MLVEQFLSHQSECPGILWVFLAGQHFLDPSKPGSITSLPKAPQKLIIVWILLNRGKKLLHNSGVAQILATITGYSYWSAVSTTKGWPHDAVSTCASSVTVLIVLGSEDVRCIKSLYLVLVTRLASPLLTKTYTMLVPKFSWILDEVTMDFRKSRSNPSALETMTPWHCTMLLNSSSFVIWGAGMSGHMCTLVTLGRLTDNNKNGGSREAEKKQRLRLGRRRAN